MLLEEVSCATNCQQRMLDVFLSVLSMLDW